MRRRVAQLARLVNTVTRRETVKEEHIDDWLDHLFAGMRRMTSHPGAFRRTFFYACGYWFFDLLCLYVTFLAFDYRIGVVYLVLGYIVAYAVGTLAPTPGGLGAVEGLMIALFVGFGVPSAIAVAVVLVYRLINFWLPIPPGLDQLRRDQVGAGRGAGGRVAAAPPRQYRRRPARRAARLVAEAAHRPGVTRRPRRDARA